MSPIGTASNPLRVAIIGSGPAAFYAADYLQKQTAAIIQIDMFDRLPTPYGLVRGGVAPDHQKIKSVTKVFEVIASKPGFRFYGNVEFGKHLALADFKDHYHQILYASGAQTDRRMEIPGEDLKGSYPATMFVAWYNGHPDFRDCQFDLSQERVAVVGVGNVAIDVSRILCLTPKELAVTDMADYAIEALSQSHVKEIYLLGRRGPAQAAFTNPEARELGEMEDAEPIVLPEDAQLDDLSKAAVAASNDPALEKKLEILQGYAQRPPSGKSRRLHMRFLVSPVELEADGSGQVAKMRLVRNVLFKSDTGTLRPKPTDQFEDLSVGLVFRSVGYLGVPLPGVPFNDRGGVILNEKGRVIDPQTKQPVTGQYVSGWIKRGPSGVIGTNKPDSVETANGMIEDLGKGALIGPTDPDPVSTDKLIHERQPQLFTFEDWRALDKIEVARGLAKGRPRIKFTSVQEMLAALGR